MWDKVEKKMTDWCTEFREEMMGIWDYESKEWQQKIEERDSRIRELENELRELRKLTEKGEAELQEENQREETSESESEGDVQEVQVEAEWEKAMKKRKKNRKELVEALADDKVQRKIIKVTVEAQDKKKREKNIVIKGWSEMSVEDWEEEEKKDAKKWGQAVISSCVKSEVQIEEAEWYGSEDRKVLVVKLKSREDKSNILKKRGNLRGTKIYLEDDLTREERKKRQMMLGWRSGIREGDEKAEVWIRKNSMKIGGKWVDFETCWQWNEQMLEKERLEREQMECQS